MNLCVLIVIAWPDIKRYLRISKMKNGRARRYTRRNPGTRSCGAECDFAPRITDCPFLPKDSHDANRAKDNLGVISAHAVSDFASLRAVN